MGQKYVAENRFKCRLINPGLVTIKTSFASVSKISREKDLVHTELGKKWRREKVTKVERKRIRNFWAKETLIIKTAE